MLEILNYKLLINNVVFEKKNKKKWQIILI